MAASWAGMVYLTLFLCSKFAVTIPYLLPHAYNSKSTISFYTTAAAEGEALASAPQTPLRKQAAAPPVWTIILPIIPISTAIYISSTRFSDFRHHGFDIIFGSLMGAIISWASFRLYHLPIRRGAGWSWGPRSASRAWYIGVGVSDYAGDDQDRRKRDLEGGESTNQFANGSPVKTFASDPEGSGSSRGS